MAKGLELLGLSNKRNRKGVHAKSKTSRNKKSKLYKKPYNRQGR